MKQAEMMDLQKKQGQVDSIFFSLSFPFLFKILRGCHILEWPLQGHLCCVN